MAKHRAQRYRKPQEWRGRALRNRWYGFIKPEIRARYRALRRLVKAFITK